MAFIRLLYSDIIVERYRAVLGVIGCQILLLEWRRLAPQGHRARVDGQRRSP